jgi:environmental stress-induced protein Ves
MRILRAATYRRMPWKNGNGETTEIAVSPPGASFDTFDWRLSIAEIGASGPFSLFPGIDRTLSVIAGDDLMLTQKDRAPVTLDRRAAPFFFRGEVAVDSTLLGGPIEDLNVMTRRSRCHHRVQRLELTEATELALSAEITVLVAIAGAVEIVAEPDILMLDPKDALVLQADDATVLSAIPQGAADLFVVEIAFE